MVVSFIVSVILTISAITLLYFTIIRRDGVLSPWSDWNACDKPCGGGTQTRTRTYTPPQYGGKDPEGYTTLSDSQGCNQSPCPIDGVLGPWSDWNACDKPCGGGTQTRTRTYTPPKYGGKNADGYTKLSDSQGCNVAPCPVDGVLGPWTDWSVCDKPCGGGTQTRTRTYTPPQYGGKNADGYTKLSDSQGCNVAPCPVDGVLGPWTDWSACDKPCGGGTQTRTRTYTPPKYGGKNADGYTKLSDSQGCNVAPCPVDGILSPWTDWSVCDKPCGGGTQTRTRTYTPPQYGGKNADGYTKLSDSQGCNVAPCPVDGVLGPWTDWSACDKPCGGGTQTRTRTYTPPQYGGKNADGYTKLSESQGCNQSPCPVDGKFTDWVADGSCSKACGGGQQKFIRTYMQPQYGGRDLPPDAVIKYEPCNMNQCVTPQASVESIVVSTKAPPPPPPTTQYSMVAAPPNPFQTAGPIRFRLSPGW